MLSMSKDFSCISATKCYCVLYMNCNTTLTSAPAALAADQGTPSPCPERQSDGNRNIVLHDAPNANANLMNAKATKEVVTAITALGLKKPALMPALVDCACSDDTAKAIAHRYSIHESVISYWSRRLGLPKRRRGRRALLHPTPEHKKILELVRLHGVAQTARRVGASKQRVYQLVCRWEPELRGHRTAVKVTTVARRKRRPARKIVVSFRLSNNVWKLLSAATPIAGEPRLSGPRKARAIVMNFITSSESTGHTPPQAP